MQRKQKLIEQAGLALVVLGTALAYFQHGRMYAATAGLTLILAWAIGVALGRYVR